MGELMKKDRSSVELMIASLVYAHQVTCLPKRLIGQMSTLFHRQELVVILFACADA